LTHKANSPIVPSQKSGFLSHISQGPLVRIDCLPISILDKYQYGKLNKQPYGTILELDPKLGIAEFYDTESRLKFSDVEKTLFSNEIHRCNGNKTLAAKRLGIAKATIFRKIKKYNLD
jgi:transcriptional regulator of acetoin/glycerol metabolism